MRSISMTAIAMLPLSLGVACTWVPLTPEGQGVQLSSSESVADCQPIGHMQSRTTTRVGPFARSPSKIREEQIALARNEAARMGGDAIVAEGPAEDGEQRFGVFGCAGESP